MLLTQLTNTRIDDQRAVADVRRPSGSLATMAVAAVVSGCIGIGCDRVTDLGTLGGLGGDTSTVGGTGEDWVLDVFASFPGFSGEVTTDLALEPGQSVTLDISGVAIPANEVLLWVEDYQRIQLWEESIVDGGRLTTRVVQSEVPVGGAISFLAPLPMLNAGTYSISVGDMDGPLSNAVRVQISVPERRMTQEDAADLWADGIALLGETVRDVYEDSDPGWVAFKQDVLDAETTGQIAGIFSGVNALAEEARTEYRALDPSVEQQLQAFLWNIGLLPMFEDLRTNTATDTGGVTNLARPASLTFMADGIPNLTERRVIHLALFKLDVIGARLLVASSVADLANIVAIATGGEGLAVTVPLTIAVNSLRIIADAVLPTDLAALELHKQFELRSNAQFRTRDFDNRWIYWATMEPQTTLLVAVGRLGGVAVSAAVGGAFPAQKVTALITAGKNLLREIGRRSGFIILSLFPDDPGDKAVTIKIVADTSLYTEPLDSSDVAFVVPVFGEAIEEIGDFFLGFVTEPAMTIESTAFPTVDVRGWRELTEEHLALNHPSISGQQTDELSVSLTGFKFSAKNIGIATIPFPEFLDPHVATVTAIASSQYDRLDIPPRRVWHYDTIDEDSSIDVATGSWIRESTPTERTHEIQVSRFSPVFVGSFAAQNQAFTVNIVVNGAAPVVVDWNGDTGADGTFIGTTVTMQPGLNTIEFTATNVEPEASGESVNLHMRFPGVVNPSFSEGREPLIDLIWEIGPGADPSIEVRMWTPPAFE